MSMNQRWTTKEDVQNDLAEVTGISVLDDDFVCDSRPPPRRRGLDVDDEEVRLQCVGAGDMSVTLAEEKQQPDLAGITQMLRMVNETMEPDLETNWRKAGQIEQSSGERLIISKARLVNSTPANGRLVDSMPANGRLVDSMPANGRLVDSMPANGRLVNPPPGFSWRDQKPLNNDINFSTNLNPEVPSFVPKGLHLVGNVNNSPVQQQYRTEIQKSDEKLLAEMLKTKILDASKADKKLEKNVAMAALLRLKSFPRPSPKDSVASSKAQSPILPKSDSPRNVVLFTPQYYESANTNIEESLQSEDPPMSLELEKRVIDWIDDTHSNKASPKLVVSPPQPQPRLVTQPVGFTKNNSPKSPPIHPSSPQNRQTINEIPSFVPSINATKLAEKYEVAIKEMKPAVKSCGFIPEEVMKKMQAKDEEFMKRRREENARAQNGTSVTGC